VKHAGQLHDRADVLMREAEVTMALLRDTMKQSAVEGLRRIIRAKLRDGSLPAGIPATIPGRPGDDSICGACDHIVRERELMMLVRRHESSPGMEPIPLHADCFQLWNEERLTFKRR
jgi:hypothetical protein